VHNDTAAVAPHAILTVIKRVGAFESRAAATRKVGPDAFKGCRTVEKLQLLSFAGLPRNLYCHVATMLADLPEPDQKRDYQQRGEWCHDSGEFSLIICLCQPFYTD
jgi:hypothetical protein